MWPFDKILLARIKELERQIEMTTGANSILERELEYERRRAERIEARLFEVSGISRAGLAAALPREGSQMPIRMGQKTANWPGIRIALENKAKQEYWDKKKAEEADKLEEEIMKEEKEE